MRVTVTGATGLIGRRLVERLLERGDEVTVLSRSPGEARSEMAMLVRELAHRADSPATGAVSGPPPSPAVSGAAPAPVSGAAQVVVEAWSPQEEPAPADALANRDGVVHLAGEPVAQRWTAEARRRIRDSRELGTRHLVAGLRAADPRPGVLVSASGIGWYGDRGDDVVDEDEPPGADFLATVTRTWEAQARKAAELGVRVVLMRTGVVLDRRGGALARMLPFFRAGVGGPVAGGRQWMAWIHLDDAVAMYLAALDGAGWEGPVNAAAPEPVRNRDFGRALGRALRRPALLPVPALALRALYGDMAWIVTTGQRAIPTRATEHGFPYTHPQLDEALRSAVREEGPRAGCPRSYTFLPPRLGTIPSDFQGESGRAGQTSQMTIPTTDSTRPVARPGFSP
ncbi:MAG TPA: TIGR01777 family oxidoreductase [Solirubrobacteraceae bacterium]|nr:TIGR01777 family oxidoreductase [Solirubrobacteraceae bacterium]